MIEGLVVTLKGTELKTLCAARALHHADMAKQYQSQADSLPEDDMNDRAGGSNTNSVKRDAHAKARERDAAASEMNFIAEHLDPTESYQLDRNDLVTLGVCKRTY